MAVNQASDMIQWYTVTKELQQASLELCEACRSAHSVHLWVDEDTPATLLAAVRSAHAEPAGGVSSRVPRLRARLVTWELSCIDLFSDRVDTFAPVEELRFGDAFNGNLDVQSWPGRLKKIFFGQRSRFDRPILGASWPTSLHHLTFGGSFNQAIEGVVLPSSLVQLSFGRRFNQPIEGMTWPMSLQRLTFGWDFDQPVKGVMWPPSLQQLRFGRNFNQSIEGSTWPTSLQRLAFGGQYNQPVGRLCFPRSLLHLDFGHFFDQPIEGVTWPTSLRLLSLGFFFNQPIARFAWPTSLQVLTFGHCFNQPIEGVAWPSSLRHLTFGEAFNQPIENSAFPASLEELAFGQHFNQPVVRTEWPSLRRLRLGGGYNQSLQTLGKAMPILERLTFLPSAGSARYVLLRGMQWPPGLTLLVVGRDADLSGVPMPSFVSIRYGGAFFL